MVTMTINFNDTKLRKKGYTAEQLLSRFDEYCHECNIFKPRINVFEKDDIHALADISKIIFEIEKNALLLDLIEEWYWVIDGVKEDIWDNEYEATWKIDDVKLKRDLGIRCKNDKQ